MSSVFGHTVRCTRLDLGPESCNDRHDVAMMQVQQAVAVALRHCDASEAAALPHITQLFHMALQVLPLSSLCEVPELSASWRWRLQAFANVLPQVIIASWCRLQVLPHVNIFTATPSFSAGAGVAGAARRHGVAGRCATQQRAEPPRPRATLPAGPRCRSSTFQCSDAPHRLRGGMASPT
jgi:hypothetical protein